ncbi:hypothetical protein [Archangium primigenium]|uniref:hypothetical protein n=1 Tax=[Archangium] primigenium TaxID=2792470 RepID=UPI00195955D2|nr:hypothetical protein [Archangium primigenium]MBM7116794.1 hypothetical protein [Archangium primigenium]
MTLPQSLELEFPAMLHGLTEDVIREVDEQSQRWAREYLESGTFTRPRRMRRVAPGELLEVTAGTLFDITPHARWRIYLFSDIFWGLLQGVPREQDKCREDFEFFCLSTPWGALEQVVLPSPPRSVRSMTRRFTALLHFWDVLDIPRYAYREFGAYRHTLDELMARLYRETMEAWCPGGPASVREHLTLTVERMARATHEDCVQAILRLAPVVTKRDNDIKHPEALDDPDFLRERLAALSPTDWEDVSGAHVYAVNGLLYDWDRALERH